MKSINRQKLVVGISKKTAYTQAVIDEIVEALFEQIKKEYRAGNRIEIREFGSFAPYVRKSKKYQNPKTMEKSVMPTRTMLKFKCSKQLYY